MKTRDQLLAEIQELDARGLACTARGDHTNARLAWANMHLVGQDLEDLAETEASA